MTATSVTSEHKQPIRRTLSRRLAASCGALFTLGILIGDDSINGAGEPPTPIDAADDSVAEAERYLANADEAIVSYWIGRGLGTLALVALLVFCGYVAREIRLREKDSGLLATVALGSGLVAVTLGLLSCTTQFAAVSRANEGIDPELARALLDVSSLTFILMWLPIAVFMTALAVAGRRLALLPAWLTVTTGVLAAALFVGLAAMPAGPVGFFPIVLSFLWFIAASVVLVRRAT